MREAAERAEETTVTVRLEIPRRGRVYVECRVVRSQRLDDRLEFRLVDVAPLEMRVEHCPAQLQLGHRTLDFADRARDIAWIERRAGREPVRVPATRVGSDVVGLPRQCGPVARPQHLYAGRGEQQELTVNAVFVHVGD